MKKLLTRAEAIKEYVANKSVLDLGVVQHSAENISKPTWLHQYIANVASDCVGVDLEADGVKALAELGYNVLCADVQSLNLNCTYDVVVAGELIEHLNDFGGFLTSVNKHLTDDGRLLLTTPNSLFIGYSLAAMVGKLEIHKQHTCWFDEVTLSQLLERFGFYVEKVTYLGSRRCLL